MQNVDPLKDVEKCFQKESEEDSMPISDTAFKRLQIASCQLRDTEVLVNTWSSEMFKECVHRQCQCNIKILPKTRRAGTRWYMRPAG